MDVLNGITTNLELLGDLEDWVTNAKARVAKAIESGVAKNAADVHSTAQELCPVDTGTLRDSLEVKLSGEYASVRADAKVAPYAYLVHFGSIHNTPDPFLYQASDLHRSELVPAIKEAFDNGD